MNDVGKLNFLNFFLSNKLWNSQGCISITFYYLIEYWCNFSYYWYSLSLDCVCKICLNCVYFFLSVMTSRVFFSTIAHEWDLVLAWICNTCLHPWEEIWGGYYVAKHYLIVMKISGSVIFHQTGLTRIVQLWKMCLQSL